MKVKVKMKIIEEKEINVSVRIDAIEAKSSLYHIQRNVYDCLETGFPNYHIKEINIDLKFIAHCKLTKIK